MQGSFSLASRIKGARKPISTEIQLTTWETRIFRFLCRVASVASTTKSIELRVAGGWVRDKILHKDNGDIDIAVQNDTGYQFASRVHDFAQAKKKEFPESSIDDIPPTLGCKEYVPDISTVALIPRNPSMSRHLETATVRLDGYDLDFVQLRTENYATTEPHRIPSSVSAGTPEQDSVRRDFTINALYYNLHTGVVEDFTQNGLADLSNELIRTPLDPKITLVEDPLRALRAIRFACRLQFELHPSLGYALSSQVVKDSLKRKVSRERVGMELHQILNSSHPLQGLRMFAKYDLVESVFLDSFRSESGCSEPNYSDSVKTIEEALRLVRENEDLLSDNEKQNFQDYGLNVLVHCLLMSHAKQVRKVLHEALRRPKRLQKDVSYVLRASSRLGKVVQTWHAARQNGDKVTERDMWLEMAEIVHQAGHQLWLAVVVSCCNRSREDGLFSELINSGISSSLCSVSPVLNGKKLQAELDIQPGPEVGRALKELIRLQLLRYWRKEGPSHVHPMQEGVLNADMCIRLLKERLSSTCSRA